MCEGRQPLCHDLLNGSCVLEVVTPQAELKTLVQTRAASPLHCCSHLLCCLSQSLPSWNPCSLPLLPPHMPCFSPSAPAALVPDTLDSSSFPALLSLAQANGPLGTACQDAGLMPLRPCPSEGIFLTLFCCLQIISFSSPPAHSALHHPPHSLTALTPSFS